MLAVHSLGCTSCPPSGAASPQAALKHPTGRGPPPSCQLSRMHRKNKGSSSRLLPKSQVSAIEQGETKHLFKGVGKRGNQTSRSERGCLPFQSNDSTPDFYLRTCHQADQCLIAEFPHKLQAHASNEPTRRCFAGGGEKGPQQDRNPAVTSTPPCS